MENAYFRLKTLFVLKIFKCLFRRFGHVEKQVNNKAKVKANLNDVTDQQTINYNAHVEMFFLKKRAKNQAERLVPDLFFFSQKSFT